MMPGNGRNGSGTGKSMLAVIFPLRFSLENGPEFV